MWGVNVYFMHTGHVTDQIIMPHNWKQGKGIKGEGRDKACNEYIWNLLLKLGQHYPLYFSLGQGSEGKSKIRGK